MRINYRAWDFVEGIRLSYQPAEGHVAKPAMEWTAEWGIAAARHARLRDIEFGLKHGFGDIIEGLPNEHGPLDGTGLVYRERRAMVWTTWTQAGVGRVRDNAPEVTELIEAIGGLDPDASILRVAQRFGLPIEDYWILGEAQNLKRHCPTLNRCLRELSPTEAEGLLGLLAFLAMAAQNPANRRLGNDGGAARIPAGALRGRAKDLKVGHLTHRLIAGQRDLIIPLLVDAGNDYYYYAPYYVASISKIVSISRKMPDGKQMSERAASAFVDLVKALLEVQGYDVAQNRVPLTQVSLKRSGEKDVDILGRRGDTAYVIEVKAEAEPPGAWSDEGMAQRRKTLGDYQSKVEEKAEAWASAFKENRPYVWKNRVRVPLKEAWASITTVKPIIISARVEPSVPLRPAHVLSYMPPVPKRVTDPLFVDAPICPRWDGMSALP